MKRITALFLAMIMVFLMFPVSTLTDATAITEKPFYCVNMSGSGGDNPLTYSQPYFYCGSIDENTGWPQVSCYGTSYEGELAQKLKEDFDSRPVGTRYFQLHMLRTIFNAQVDKVIFFDEAVETVKMWLTDFLTEYKKIGGELDGIIVDLEYITNEAWYIQDVQRNTNPNIYKDIVADSRYAAEVKPRLQEYGFDFIYENTADTELISISRYVGSIENTKYKVTNADIWDHVVKSMEREAINDAVLYPLQNFYPDATMSDYQSATYNSWEKALDIHGALETNYNIVGAGNVSNQNSYNGRPSFAVDRDLVTPPGYNNAYFSASPFASSQYDVNLFKNMVASTDGPIDAWIADYWYDCAKGTTQYLSSFCQTPYYTENIYHIGMLDPKPFLGYLITDEIEKYGHTLEEAMGIVSDIMVELTRIVGTSDRKPILIPQTQAYWNAGYILSGMYSGGRNVWRLTPDTNKVSLEAFKIKDKAPTFSVDGVTITFPQGRIIEDGDVRIAGSCGYWIETPAGVEPVITATNDRYTKNPALLETFEDYTAGTSFTTAAALPTGAWTVSGAATVRANGTNNKSLGLVGTTTVKSVKLPANVTAGDAYAKQQVWEATVTMPASMSTSAIIKLLYATNNDYGFTIRNNTVYYNNNTSLGNLTAGSTYTFRREMDFRTAGNFKCTYSVLDVNGNVLYKAENKSIPNITLPTASISFTTDTLSKEVLIDNYKLYVTGVSTVLELYDAKMGNKVTDTSVARTADTAYRMSWMNATNTPAVAEVYDITTGKVFETVEMAPNMDGYVTAVVSASSSSSVKLAVRTLGGTATTPPNYDNGDFDWPTVEENMSQMGKAQITLPSVNANGQNVNLDVLLNEGETVYLLTNGDGKAVYTGASANNYNIKFTYPENGIPTLYLKNAKLTNGQGHALTVGNTATETESAIDNFSLIIHVEADSVIAGIDNVEGQAGTYSAIYSNLNPEKDCTLTITGSGKLTATSEGQWAIVAFHEVIIKDATFVGKTTIPASNGMRAAIYVDNNVTIDNSTVELYATHGPVINLGNKLDGLSENSFNKLTIRNGSDVKIANPESASYLPAVMCGGEITIDRSSVEITTKNKCFYNGPELILVDAAYAGASSATATTYDPENASSYQYFSTHMHKVSVLSAVRPTCTETGKTEGSRCTVSTCRNKLIVAQTKIPATGHIADVPVIENMVVATTDRNGSYYRVTYCAVCGIEMSRVPVTIPANNAVNSFTVALPMNNPNNKVSVAEGAETKYFLTDPTTGKVIDTGANANNYNLKLAYPLNGEPTIYLKDAKLINNVGHALDISSTNVTVVIHVESDSTLEGQDNPTTDNAYGAVSSTCALTFTGTGKLTATSQSFHTINMGSGTLTFKDANVSATASVKSGTYCGIMNLNGDIVIDNSTVETASSAGYGMLISNKIDSIVGNPYDIVIKNGSNVKVNGVYALRPVLGCTGDIIISDSALEVQGTSKSISHLPIMSGVTPYGGSNPENFQLFNEMKIGSYTYFKTVPCAHTGGKATCDEKAVCKTCGYYYGDFAHVPEADDGDCTTAVKCTLCGVTLVYANSAHNIGPVADCVNDQICTTCGIVFVEATGHDNTYTDLENGTHEAFCGVCGDTIEEPHNFVDGECVCGAEETVEEPGCAEGVHTYTNAADSTCNECGESRDDVTPLIGSDLKFAGNYLSCQEYIGMMPLIRKTAYSAYAKAYVVAVQTCTDGTSNTVTLELESYGNGKTYSMVNMKIMSCDMTDNITMVLYGETADGIVYRCSDAEMISTSVEELALEKIEAQAALGTAQGDTWCSILVNMLNYGAAVQTGYNDNVTSLPNTNLGDYVKYATVTDPTFSKEITSTGSHSLSADLGIYMSMQAQVELTMYIKLKSGDNIANYEMHVTPIGGETVVYTADTFGTQGSYYVPKFALKAEDFRTEYTVVLIDTRTGEAASKTYTASVEGKGNATLANADLAPVVLAMMKYGDSVSALAALL